MAHLTTLRLAEFRCYPALTLQDLPCAPVVLHGPNGAGKTNILEAVSLLVPGRGMRGAKPAAMLRRDAPAGAGWGVSADVLESGVPVSLGTGLPAGAERRVVRINGETVRGQTLLAEYLSCVWLTPQMDRLFVDGASDRRRFLDRLVFAFDPGHSGRVTRYESAMAQRSALLRGGRADARWLDGLEAQMAETGVAIAAARRSFLHRLQRACDESGPEDEALFPRAALGIGGWVEQGLERLSALEVEERFRAELLARRGDDAQSGGAAVGPHKVDFLVRYAARSMPADQCSTGEQKALLIGIVMAHARLLAAERGFPPVLLLDEVAAHLDPNRRAALYRMLRDLKGQVFLTGTEAELFAALERECRMLRVEAGQVTVSG